MPELTLADVERLEGLRDERDATRLAFNGSQQASWLYKQMLDAYLAYREALMRDGDRLIALAREALERRRDADAASDPALSAQLHEMMRDPRYWRDRDPEYVARVTAGFRKLFPG